MPEWATMRYYQIRARLEYGILWNMSTARYFMFLSWLALRGKIAIITSDTSRAKGGYKYFNLVISKMPVSSSHDYEDLF